MTRRILIFVEWLHLIVHGWRRVSRDCWTAPVLYPYRRHESYTHGHAINAQKQLDAAHARRPKRRVVGKV